MNQKNKGIIILIFAAFYFIYTTFIIKHGIMLSNTVITGLLSIWGIVYILRSKKVPHNLKKAKQICLPNPKRECGFI
jgi:hypothetical protein